MAFVQEYQPTVCRWRIGMRATVSILLTLVLWCPPAVPADFIQARSLDFIRARGGLEVGEPRRHQGRWQLPLSCDLSGIESFTEPSRVLHSRLAWWRNDISVEGQDILLTVESAMQSPRAPRPRCGDIDLGRIASGRYRLYYRNPDGSREFLRELLIGAPGSC